jgi:hypothetical protein
MNHFKKPYRYQPHYQQTTHPHPHHHHPHQLNNLITELQPFFLTTMGIVKKSQRIQPNQKDTLFWCYYILRHGMSCYEQQFQCGSGVGCGTITYVREKQHKIQLVEEVRDPLLRNKLKQFKLFSLEHFENQLANETTIDLATFFSLCYLFDIQLFYFKRRSYYQTLPEDLPWIATKQMVPPLEIPSQTEGEGGGKEGDLFDRIYDKHGTGYDLDDFDFETVLVLHQTSGNYWIEPTNILDIEWKKCFRIHNINKPLKGISSYTVAQIKEIARNMDMDVAGKTKQEVYDLTKEMLTLDIN